MFNNKDFANEFQQYLNSRHNWIWTWQRNSVFRYPSKTRPQHYLYDLSTRKKTFTGFYTKWDSFSPRKYKILLLNVIRPGSDLSLLPNLLLLFFATICPGWSKKTSTSEWLPPRKNQFPREWCFGTKPKQARCSFFYGSLEGCYYFVTLFRSSKATKFLNA